MTGQFVCHVQPLAVIVVLKLFGSKWNDPRVCNAIKNLCEKGLPTHIGHLQAIIQN